MTIDEHRRSQQIAPYPRPAARRHRSRRRHTTGPAFTSRQVSRWPGGRTRLARTAGEPASLSDRRRALPRHLVLLARSRSEDLARCGRAPSSPRYPAASPGFGLEHHTSATRQGIARRRKVRPPSMRPPGSGHEPAAPSAEQPPLPESGERPNTSWQAARERRALPRQPEEVPAAATALAGPSSSPLSTQSYSSNSSVASTSPAPLPDPARA